jgi:hypothetical protein
MLSRRRCDHARWLRSRSRLWCYDGMGVKLSRSVCVNKMFDLKYVRVFSSAREYGGVVKVARGLTWLST